MNLFLRTSRQRTRELPLAVFFPLIFVLLYLSHFTLLRLPYFWDEAGYYIPAALDFFRTGTLIPFTTITNAHPPLPSILLSAWWHVAGFVPSATRTCIILVAAFALLAVFRIARQLAGNAVAAVTVVLTAAYPVWFAQSSLAHADIFAAAFTLWAFAFYLDRTPRAAMLSAFFFSLAALAKETAILTPAALWAWEAYQTARPRKTRREHLPWLLALAAPAIPLICWYAYHHHRTGFTFGNPEFLRYNATSTLDAKRISLSLWHRFLHLTVHMNMWTATLLTVAILTLTSRNDETPKSLPRPALIAISIVLLTNLVEFSVLGGALLTRYLLPAFPLLLLLCVHTWRSRFRYWLLPAGISLAGFVIGCFINPPYAFAPEDNLTYRDFIVLHQQAISVVAHRFPEARVLTAWPAWAEMMHPELGYTRQPIHVVPVQNFSLEQLRQAQGHQGDFDTALLFSTKYEPHAGQLNLGKPMENSAAQYFDFHRDLLPNEAAALLHGQVVWQAYRNGEWAAVLRFPRVMDASLARSAPSKPL